MGLFEPSKSYKLQIDKMLHRFFRSDMFVLKVADSCINGGPILYLQCATLVGKTKKKATIEKYWGKLVIISDKSRCHYFMMKCARSCILEGKNITFLHTKRLIYSVECVKRNHYHQQTGDGTYNYMSHHRVKN